MVESTCFAFSLDLDRNDFAERFEDLDDFFLGDSRRNILDEQIRLEVLVNVLGDSRFSLVFSQVVLAFGNVVLHKQVVAFRQLVLVQFLYCLVG